MLEKIKEYLYYKKQNRNSRKFNKRLYKEFTSPRADRRIKLGGK